MGWMSNEGLCSVYDLDALVLAAALLHTREKQLRHKVYDLDALVLAAATGFWRNGTQRSHRDRST